MNGLKWIIREPDKWYAQGVHDPWDGFAIHHISDDEMNRYGDRRYMLFSDDGAGNGKALGSFDTLGDAQAYAYRKDGA